MGTDATVHPSAALRPDLEGGLPGSGPCFVAPCYSHLPLLVECLQQRTGKQV